MFNAAMTIAGRAVESPTRFDVFDPATGEVFGRAPDCSIDQLDAAMRAAEEAFDGWSVDAAARSEALIAAADIFDAHANEIARVLVSEQGKPLADAKIEIAGAVARLRFAANLRLEPELLQDDEVAKAVLVRRPHGVVAAISPWNAPLIISMAKVGPALAAGNTVVLKPSPFTPLSSLMVGELLRDAFPAGVLNVVTGKDGVLGAAITAHPTPRMVDFTGSIGTGKLVAEGAAADLKRVALELGGNDAAVVLEDADPAELAEQIFWCAFANCGQVCVAIKRLYVPRTRYGPWVEALTEVATNVKVGPGLEEGVRMGPLNNRPQRDYVERLVDEARREGATATAGGAAIDRPGNFYAPTIVADASAGMSVVDDEQFGPVLPIVPYDDVDDAIAAANATHYGLGGSVWGSDVERAVELAGRLECGSAWVNTHRVLAAHIPFEGRKWSGYGGNAGTDGFHEFTESQVIYIRH